MDRLPKKCLTRCCKKKQSKHDRGLVKAREALEKEVEIFTMIKSRRYFHLALRYLLPKQVRLDLKKASQFIVINPDRVSEKPKGAEPEMKELEDIRCPDQTEIVNSNSEIEGT